MRQGASNKAHRAVSHRLMNCFGSKSLRTLAACGLFAIVAQADLAEFNAINEAARAASSAPFLAV